MNTTTASLTKRQGKKKHDFAILLMMQKQVRGDPNKPTDHKIEAD